MNPTIIDQFVEVTLKHDEDFLKIKETLTRIGSIKVNPDTKQKSLIQSCHILHKKGKYYIVHFKEMYLLDGKDADFTPEDIARRNTITKLLGEWELLTVVKPDQLIEFAPIEQIKILAYKDKKNWLLESKYAIGKKRR